MQRQLPVILILTLLSLLIIGTVSSTLLRREPPMEVSPTPDQSYPATWTPTPFLPAPVSGEDTNLLASGVIVALQPIPHGSEFLPGMIGRRDWPTNNVPPGIIN